MDDVVDRKMPVPAQFGQPLASMDELRQIMPAPARISYEKIQKKLDHHCRTFIALSTFVTLATASAAGECDSSPRGGPAGFVKILDDSHLLIPEVIGNRQADTLSNVIDNPHVGLLFVIPGLEETLRANGRAWLVNDPQVLATCAVMDKVPQLAIGVELTEIYLHCAKALRRGQLWRQAGWPDRSALASPAQIWRDHSKGAVGDGTVAAMQALLDESYTKRLY
jgi:uncharacterized protein